MATVGSKNMTYIDWASRTNDGKIQRIIEQMAETNEILQDMVVIPSSESMSHKTTVRTGLPTWAWRQLNKGTQPSKSTTAVIEAQCGIMEAISQIDEEVLALYEDKAAARLSEVAAFTEALEQGMATNLFYGDITTNSAAFTGLTPHYNTTDTSKAKSAKNVIKGGGSGDDCTSLWLVVWGEETIHAFFPKNSTAGLEHKDLGEKLLDDGTESGTFINYFVDQFKWKLGIAVRDWRYAVRVCNLDKADMATVGDAGTADKSPNIFKLMIQAKNLIPNLKKGKAVWYCNRDVYTFLEIKALEKTINQLTIQDLQDGKTVTKFMGIPVRLCDAILSTETALA